MVRFLRWALVLAVTMVLAISVFTLIVKANPEPPAIPHSLSGYERCLSCHNAQGLGPLPLSHTTFAEDACLSCHSSAAGLSANSACLSCHGQSGLSMTIASGEKLAIHVDPKVFAASVHGDKLLCTDCHNAITTYPHPKREIPSRREYNIAQYEVCKRCHFDNYTKTLDSIHYEILSRGNLSAPLCTDCHGAHDVTLPSQPRTKVSQTCAKCHQDIYRMYAESVHGKALIQEDNHDVPVCIDCHLSHTIEDPRTATFRLESVELCSGCHSNERMMQKYGISTEVVKSYLQDFHGKTVALTGRQGKDIWVKEAVCSDCHGIHDIQKIDDPNSPVIKANLVATCQKCHSEATASFPGAWLSHYAPSVNKAPLVFFVRWFYWILIPFVLVGLLVHILLDLWRTITNR